MTELKPLSGITPRGGATEIVPGSQVLWRGVPTGKKGGPSTKEEHFNGTVHEVKRCPNDGELIYYVS